MSEKIIETLRAKIADPNIPPNMRRQFQDRLALFEKSAQTPQEDAKNLRGSKITGITLYCQQTAKKERETGSKLPSKIAARVINIPAGGKTGDGLTFWDVDEGFGKIMKFKDLPAFITANSEMEHAKLKDEGEPSPFPIVNWEGLPPDYDDIHEEEEILLAFIREKGVKGSKTAFVDKKLHSYMIIRAGTVFWPSVFSDKIASMNGDYVIVKGVRFEDYEGFPSINASSIAKAKTDPVETANTIFRYNCERYPRFLNEFPVIDQERISWEDKKNHRRRLSFALEKYLSEPTQICSFETRDRDGESLKSKTVIFKKMDPTSFYYEVPLTDGSNDKKKVHQLVFQQRAIVMTPETKKTETVDGVDVEVSVAGRTEIVLLNLSIRSADATRIVGISNVDTFMMLAERHVGEIRFVYFAYPDHDATMKLEVNNPLTKDPMYAEIHHAVEYKTSSETNMKSSLPHYVATQLLQLDLATVKKLLGDVLKYEANDPKSVNPYNQTVQKYFINLTEYNGSMNDFATNYDFFLMSNDTQKEIDNVREIEDVGKRNAKILQELQGLAKGKDVSLKKFTKKEGAIFAIHHKYLKEIRANPNEYSLENLYNAIETRQEKYDPDAVEVAAAAAAAGAGAAGEGDATADTSDKSKKNVEIEKDTETVSKPPNEAEKRKKRTDNDDDGGDDEKKGEDKEVVVEHKKDEKKQKKNSKKTSITTADEMQVDETAAAEANSSKKSAKKTKEQPPPVENTSDNEDAKEKPVKQSKKKTKKEVSDDEAADEKKKNDDDEDNKDGGDDDDDGDDSATTKKELLKKKATAAAKAKNQKSKKSRTSDDEASGGDGEKQQKEKKSDGSDDNGDDE